jgi:GrpB-like predicted nucleotidyltransferase (UPF0157 family)
VAPRAGARKSQGRARGKTRVVPYDPEWPNQFEWLRKRLKLILPTARIEHVGSTAVPGCEAKPIIDVSVGLAPRTRLRVDEARSIGLEFRSVSPESSLFAATGHDGSRTAHVHVNPRDDEAELRVLRFRDFLRVHPEVVRDYVEVKRRALATGKTGGNYTNTKAPFIEGLEPRVRRWARRRSWTPGGRSAESLRTPKHQRRLKPWPP